MVAEALMDDFNMVRQNVLITRSIWLQLKTTLSYDSNFFTFRPLVVDCLGSKDKVNHFVDETNGVTILRSM
jgi:hypothetical protein